MKIATNLKKTNNMGRPLIYDFHRLNKKQCMVFESVDKNELEKRRRSVTACAYERGYKITTRIDHDPGREEFVLKVWVTKKGKQKK